MIGLYVVLVIVAVVVFVYGRSIARDRAYMREALEIDAVFVALQQEGFDLRDRNERVTEMSSREVAILDADLADWIQRGEENNARARALPEKWKR